MAGLEGVLFEDSGQSFEPTTPESYLTMAGATVRETLISNPVAALYRAGELSLAKTEPDVVPAEEARTKIKAEGFDGKLLIPDKGISRSALEILLERKRDERLREEIFANSPTGIGAQSLKLAMGLGTSLIDPINVASAFIPVVGEARYAKYLGKAPGALRRYAVRGGVGAVEGTVGAAALEPVIATSKRYDQADYEMADSLLNVGFGGVFGAGLHVTGGALGDAWNYARGSAGDVAGRVAPETREAGLRSAIAQIINGERVNVEPLMNMDPRASAIYIKPAESLTPGDRAIETRFAKQVTGDVEAAMAAYDRLPESEGGKVINADLVRELSPDYLANRSKAGAVHSVASWLTDRLYERALAKAERGGEVVFSAGGAGSGKSVGLNMLGIKNQIVVDGTLSKPKYAIEDINKALDAGQTVRVLYTYRDPLEAFKGTLKRAMEQENTLGSGRTVPLEFFVKGHEGARSTLPQLMHHYADDPRVKFDVIDNSKGFGEAKRVDFAELPHGAYNELRERASQILEENRASGAISEAVYRGTRGDAAPDRAGEPGRVQPEGGRQPEPQRAGRATDQVGDLAPVRSAAEAPKLSTVADEKASDVGSQTMSEETELLARTEQPTDADLALIEEDTAQILAGLKSEGVEVDMTAADALVAEAEEYADAAHAAVACGLKHA